MNILKNVVNKIAEGDKKTELKSEKVELANIKELDKFVKALDKASSQISNNKKKLGADLREIEAVKDRLEKNYNTVLENKKAVELAINNAEKLADEIAKQAKDLGLDIRDIKNIPELIQLVQQVESDQEVIDSFINMSKKYL